MKNQFNAALICLLLLLPFLSKSQTTVSGTIASATWSVSGSPYLVSNNVTVNGLLTIQPGVEVIFQGHYLMLVYGNIQAIGTATQPIAFHASDTTGWSNDIVPSGGWRGIYLYQTSGLDSTVFEYCKFSDVKHGVNAANNYNALISGYYRNINLKYCEIFHNQSTANQSVGCIITAGTNANQYIHIAHCNIHHNKTRVAAVKLDNYVGGTTHLHHNRFHHNTEGGTVFALWTDMLFEQNEVDSNSNVFIGLGTIRYDGRRNTIRNNSIHHNVNERLGAIGCTMGRTTIEKNLICNNQMTDASCGATDGGAGIHISSNNSLPYDSTEYIIRDNIIANNEASFQGCAIYIYDCKAHIYNNHIIHNKNTLYAPAIYGFGNNMNFQIQNNIFDGNMSTMSNGGMETDVFLAGTGTYSFDHNFMNYPFYKNTLISGTVVRTGDTLSNPIGANAMLVNPTPNAGIASNAMLYDFHLQASSPCVNQGDTLGLVLSSTDYYGNNRIMGGVIDIDAHELSSDQPQSVTSIKSQEIVVYPNPNQGQFMIQIPSAWIGKELHLYSVLGEKVMTTQLKQKTTQLVTQLSKGIYFGRIDNALIKVQITE